MKTVVDAPSRPDHPLGLGAPRAARHRVRRARPNAVAHMTHTVVALVTSVGLQSAFGFVFVVIAARMFGASASGDDLTMIAVARGVAAVVQLDVAVVVHRLLPRVVNPVRFVKRTYATTTSVAIVMSLAVVFVGGQFSDVVHRLVSQPTYAAYFVVAVATWNVFALQDVVLATLRRGRVVVIESAVYGLAAITSLFIARELGIDRPILVAFFAPIVPLAIGVSWFVFRRAIPADLELDVERSKLDVRAESKLIIGDFVMSGADLVIRAVVPVIVADSLGSEIAAGYAVASAIGFAMGDLVTSIQRSLATELSRHPEQRARLLRRSLRMVAFGVVPAVAVLIAVSSLVLRVFGSDFTSSAPYLRFLLLSTIPASLTSIGLTFARWQRATKLTVGTLALVHSLVVTVMILFLDDHGTIAIGIAYLVGWSAALVPSGLFLVRRGHARYHEHFDEPLADGETLVDRGLVDEDLVDDVGADAAPPTVDDQGRLFDDWWDPQFRSRLHWGPPSPMHQAVDGDVDDAALGAADEARTDGVRVATLFDDWSAHDVHAEVRVDVGEHDLDDDDDAVAADDERDEDNGVVSLFDDWLVHHFPANGRAAPTEDEADEADETVEADETLEADEAERSPDEPRDVAPPPSLFDDWTAVDDWTEVDDDEREALVGATRRAEPAPAPATAPSPPRRAARSLQALTFAGSALAAVAPFVSLTPLRVAGVLAAMLVLPGVPLARWLRYGTETVPIVWAVLSMSAWTLLGLATIELDWWHPVALYETLVGLSAVVLFAQNRRVRDAARLRIRWSDLDARSVLIIVTSIAMVVIATRGVVRSVDPETYGSHGLIAAAPYGYHLALALVLAAFVYNLWRERFSQLCAAVSVVSTLFLLHGVLPLVYGTPRFGWSPKYVGVIEYAIDNHAFNRNIDAYHNWPGFFTVAAQFSDLVDVRPLSYAPWAPLFFNLLAIAALDFMYRSFSSDHRQRWMAMMLFILANWVGQDYLAPQAFVLVMAFVLLGLVARLLSAFPSRTRFSSKLLNPFVRRLSRTGHVRPDLPFFERANVSVTVRRRAFFACMGIYGAIAVSHQLTPVGVLLTAVALAVFRRLVRPTLVVAFMVAILIGTMLAAHAYFSRNTYLLQIPNPFRNASTTPFSQRTEQPDAGMLLAYRAGLLCAATIAVLALVGLWRRIRAGFADVELMLICVAPVLVAMGIRYGAEAPLRAYLYALPGLCLLAAFAFLPRRSSWRSLPGGALCVLMTVLLGFGLIVAAYGRESINYIRADELAVGRTLGEVAPDGSFVVTIAPGQDAKITRGYFRVVYGVDGTTSIFDVEGFPVRDDTVNEATVAAIVTQLSDEMGNRNLYIVAGQSQREYVRSFGMLSPDSYNRLIALLRANPNLAVVAERGGAVAFQVIKIGSESPAG